MFPGEYGPCGGMGVNRAGFNPPSSAASVTFSVADMLSMSSKNWNTRPICRQRTFAA